LLKLAWVIDFHVGAMVGDREKLATIPLFGALIAWNHNTSVAALSNKYAVRLIGPPLLARANITPN
jgi:hypothetical protein